MIRSFGLLVVLMLCIAGVSAQETISPQIVTLTAADGVSLVGDFYAASAPAPSVLLMHMADSNRASWSESVPLLLEAGYNVLAVDLRSWGDSGGTRNMDEAINDVQAWFDWLRDQPNVMADQFAVMGASIGANLAIVGCANEAGCVTVIALSPGRDYFGVQPLDSLEALTGRSMLLLNAHRDGTSGSFPLRLAEDSQIETALIEYPGIGYHGTQLISNQPSVLPLIMTWLETHLGA